MTPAELALRIPVQVGPTGVVLHDTHQYTMPPQAIGLPGTLFLYRDRVRIVAGRWSAEHPRLFQRGAKSALPEHHAAMVATVAGTRGRRYLKRQQLLELGGPVHAYLTELVHRRPRAWMDEVDALHELMLLHGPEMLRDAIAHALAQQVFGAEYVLTFLASRYAALSSVQPQELLQFPDPQWAPSSERSGLRLERPTCSARPRPCQGTLARRWCG